MRKKEALWTQGRAAQDVLPTPWELGAYLNEEKRKLEDVLDLLTPKQRDAVRLVYLENDDGLSNQEVAKKLKISLDSP